MTDPEFAINLPFCIEIAKVLSATYHPQSPPENKIIFHPAFVGAGAALVASLLTFLGVMLTKRQSWSIKEIENNINKHNALREIYVNMITSERSSSGPISHEKLCIEATILLNNKDKMEKQISDHMWTRNEYASDTAWKTEFIELLKKKYQINHY